VAVAEGGTSSGGVQKYGLGSTDSGERYNLRFTRLTLMCGLYKNQNFQMVFKKYKVKI
jgi:hypothetical protein